MKIGIVGCGGRMGRMLIAQVMKTDGAELAAGSEMEGSPLIGQDLGGLTGLGDVGIAVTDDARDVFSNADVVIDFTLPSATIKHAEMAMKYGTGLVLGTTGLGVDQQAVIEAASRETCVLQAPNMSVGVNVLFAMTKKVAALLDEDYDIEIVEMHHRHKVDAPSGTALGLGKAAAAGRQVDLDEVSDRVRDGHTGARERGNIGFATLRGGDVAGDHTVIFAADGERVELTHKASSREVFARGAVRAALWLEDKTAGLYSMEDVLGL
ncbi:MAG: 4-hydroxy-tetrahydrodipicolinate reductase [Rhodospirillales bacterium]|nr:4-hydroxy-tetrahydrodipicolinate reductase [Rhodospirillales bacterium]